MQTKFQMPRRLLFYGFHALELSAAVKLACEQADADIAYWIGVNNGHTTFDEDITEWHIGNIELPNEPFDSNMRCQIIALKFAQIREQLLRNTGCANLSDRELLELSDRIFHKFQSLLYKQRIEHLFFQNLPHEGFEYILYLAAQTQSIPTTLCYQSILPNRFFYCYDLNDFGHFKACSYVPSEIFSIPKAFEKELFYMTGFSPTPNRKQFTVAERTKWSIRDWKRRSGYYRLIGKSQSSRSPEQEYLWNLSRIIDQDFDTNAGEYVYFPLHLQPELTTSAIGDEYFDQALAIERVSKWLPSGVRLVLKENPKQDYRWRPSAFFERIRRLKNVCWVPTETNTYELLRRSLFAVTITGTIGWEAITGGRPVIVLGRPWYLKLPGVYQWNSNLDFEAIRSSTWPHEELEQALQRLLGLARIGIVDVNYAKSIANYDAAANSLAVAAFLREQIENVAYPAV